MTRLALALAGLTMAAAPAAADISPREVWDDWIASLEESEAEVATGSVEEDVDRVVVSGLSIVSEDEGYSLEVEEVVLVQNGDGTVGVTVSPEYPLVLNSTDEEGDETETHLLVRHPDLTMTVADEAEMRQHAFSAPEIRVLVEEVLENGEPQDAEGEVVFEDVSARYDIGEAEDGETALSAARIGLDMNGTDADSGEDWRASINVQGFDSENVLQILGADTAEIARGLPDGEALSGTLSSDGTTFRFESESDEESSAFAGTVGPGEADLGLSADGLSYAGQSRDLALNFSGSSVPLPQVTVGVGAVAFGIEVPVLASEEPQPYAFNLSLLDVALDEGLWNMMDTAGILPRDPGEIALDLSGEVAMDQDLDTRGVADDAGDEVRSVELNTLRIAFAGAEADASGSLTINESADGEPVPVGQIEVLLIGATELLDRLVQAGILPQEQAMGARMMLSMFATPGAREGEMISTIRLTESGQVFVNDQQVR